MCLPTSLLRRTLPGLLLLLLPYASAAQTTDTVAVERLFKGTDTTYVFTKAERDSIRAIVGTAFTAGELTPGKGFEIAHGKHGTVNFSIYALIRYVNQEPESNTFNDHLGRERSIDPRKDIQWHRTYLYFNGWAFTPKLMWQVNSWAVLSTGQNALIGSLTYRFHKRFNLSGGINGLPSTRSMQGSHPLWQANDRAMADEYFRPGFSSGIWATGEILPKLSYTAVVTNNLSQLGVGAGQLDRSLSNGYSLLWMPTTGEFGPRGSYGDWEYHEKIATRFGGGYGRSREDRQNQDLSTTSGNTQVKISDSQNLFEVGALADTVTVKQAMWQQFAVDGGLKYRGIFLHVEYFQRLLNEFVADGPLPVKEINENGYMVQASAFPWKKKLELYGFHSYINGKWNTNYEFGGGLNFYPFDTRYFRVNAHAMHVTDSPANSVFGFYVGGMTGMIYSLSTSIIL
ncbi:MAG: hypothetical protein JNL43_12185 [Flavobacteriales bacterium]|nr:hypothetical protein [Flavobacteriales bacterium]